MSYPKFCPKDIIAVDVFLERFQTRTYVGILKKEKNKFVFSYDTNYLGMKNILSLGLEFPLTQQHFYSHNLFPSFLDRLPDPNNPAYMEYCIQVGIAVTTTDPIVLLASFKRGPSSFVFEPVYKEYSFKDIEKLRNELGLSLLDFGNLFDISLSSLQKIKSGQTSGKEILRLMELYLREPEELDHQIQRKIKYLHPDKTKKILTFLDEKLFRKREEREKMINRWHILSYHECEYTQKCLKHLQQCPWAQELITKINNMGLTPHSMPILFEARFAYAFYKTGLVIHNEYKCDKSDSEIKNSNVDFCIAKADSAKWFIELTSLDESDEVKRNTVVSGDAQFSMQFYMDKESNLDNPYKIYKRAQCNIFKKVAKKKKDENTATPTKFLLPKKDEYNIIIIDMRGFMPGTPDQHDYSIVINGENPNRENGVIGVFNQNHPDPRARFLQERIHGIGLICEGEYVDGEIQEKLVLYSNPELITQDELIRNFPLKSIHPTHPVG